ncbi:MAG: tRNA (adenosine(37)-N6)-threonylcarbamoyltransferase complex dimerization subunit type 1 TsaB [Candidatus Eremiobacteraeota bacterium]|nr:tRNA (adenosine(37)-N6)-threonylcarbamoyltransferase complex dimerization subunit type 1 TsaB [Candidatus Eremiobacteraeota bacterium]MBC5828082.1 tRNA (adenosine(37)-N6)-threonylcarbamoyltransferase complex dimerization subunit type 1 TsaB [Candidatus Eremiobacteraeota bacterium]
MMTLGVSTSQSVEVALHGDCLKATASTDVQALDGLLICIKRVLRESGCTRSDIGLLAVCKGPGSFTGLRIGVAFAKAFAQARDLPVIGVSAYDIVDAAGEKTYPRIAVVRASRSGYYLRVQGASGDCPKFFHGAEPVCEAAARDAGCDAPLATYIKAFASGERAESVARLGGELFSDGAESDWRRLDIDYGQRPNSVVNWENRRG